jgi:membrane protein DedA with SNARE-associated domain/membrane-associated phospholipid phosphatase
MLQTLQPLMHYIHQHPFMGALLAFLIAFTESIPIVGTIIPGSVTMIALGTLVGTGVLPGYHTLLWAACGALAGDTIGFLVGQRFHQRIPSLWPFSRYPKFLILTQNFFDKHGWLSVFIGRFIGPTRSTVPLMAGLLQMPRLHFFAAAIPSAFLWALLYMLPGILLGALALELPPHLATEFLLGGLVILLALIGLIWLIQSFFTQLTHALNRWTGRLWQHFAHYRYTRQFTQWVANKQAPNDHRQLTLLFLLLLSSLLMLGLTHSVITGGWGTLLDQPLFSLLQSIRTQSADHLFTTVTVMGNIKTTLLIGILIGTGLCLLRQFRAGIHLLGAMGGIAVCVGLLKVFYYHPRPTGFFWVSPTGSFPSGHTAATAVLTFLLIYFSCKYMRTAYRRLTYTLGGLWVLLIAISRLYLGAHWLTDIVGGLLIAAVVLTLTLVHYRRNTAYAFLSFPARHWALLLSSTLLVVAAAALYRHYPTEYKRYQPVFQLKIIRMTDWWQGTDSPPRYRLNRFGSPIQPFNIQWAGNLPAIVDTLQGAGWTLVAPEYSLKGIITRFAHTQSTYPLPLLPWLYQHQTPTLIMMKPHLYDNKLIELRLWQSNVRFVEHEVPLWVGTLNYQVPKEGAKKPSVFSTFKNISLKQNSGQATLLTHLHPGDWKAKMRHISRREQPKAIQRIGWNGNLLVIRPTPKKN